MKTKIIGLTTAQVLDSRVRFGTNSLEKRRTKGFFGKFFENLSDPIIRVLLIATLLRVFLSFGNCNWYEIGGILLAVFTAAIGWVGTVGETVSGTPILMIFAGLPLVGLGVGLFRRMLNVN